MKRRRSRFNRRIAALAVFAIAAQASCVGTEPSGQPEQDPTLVQLEERFGSFDAFAEGASLAPPANQPGIEKLAALSGGSVSELHEIANELAAATANVPADVEAPVVDWSGSSPDPTAVAEIEAALVDEATVPIMVGFAVRHVGEGALDPEAAEAQRNVYAEANSALETALIGSRSTVTGTWENLPVASIDIDAAGLAAIVDDPSIGLILDGTAEAELTLDNTVDVVEADHRDWEPGNELAGEGQTIAVIDTGIDAAHPAFSDGAGGNRIKYSACYFARGSSLPASAATRCPNGASSQFASGHAAGVPCNGTACEHGTHVAGIAAGHDSGNHDGVAPAADLVSVRLGNANVGFGFKIWLVENQDFVNAFNTINLLAAIGEPIAAVNGSFKLALGTGETCASNFLSPVFANLRSRGVTPVFSTGNENLQGSIKFPACAPETLSVSATDDLDNAWSDSTNPQIGSNIDSATDLWAPGVSVNSAVPGGGYADMSGTSMAAPHVAGAIAAIKDRLTLNDPDSIRSRLRSVGYLVNDNRPGGTAVAPRLRVSSAITPWGFVRNDGSGTVDSAQSYSSESTTAMAEVSPGLYLVALGDALDLGDAATLQATPVGGEFRKCSVEEVPFFSIAIAVVMCRDELGNPAESDFYMQATRDPVSEASPSPYREGASVRLDTPNATGVVIPTGQNVNPSGADNLVLRLNPGEYLAVFPGLEWAGQSFLATQANYATWEYCKVGASGSFFGLPAAVVRCYTPVGIAADAPFNLTMVARSGPFPGLRYHASAELATTAQYHPARQATTHWGVDQVHVRRLAVGRYQVDFGGWPASGPQPRHSFAVSSGGDTAAWCQARSDLTSTVFVDCRNPAGALVDSPFQVAAFAEHLGLN